MERRYGFDGKHASHLVRLLRSGLEILEGKGLIVRRSDADDLRAIRDGAWGYEKLMEHADALQAKIRAAAETSVLPRSPDNAQIDELLFSILD